MPVKQHSHKHPEVEQRVKALEQQIKKLEKEGKRRPMAV
jgi:polyhydroxyalkanoate synthesis regulator phasin